MINSSFGAPKSNFSNSFPLDLREEAYDPALVNQFRDPGNDFPKPSYDKLDPALSQFLEIYLDAGITDAIKFGSERRIKVRNGKLEAELFFSSGLIFENISPLLLKKYEIDIVSRSDHFLVVWIPLDSILDFTNNIAGLKKIHAPYFPHSLLQTEGVNLVGADEFHDADIRGEGMIVGVIDGGFASSTEARNNDELPEFTVVNLTNENFNQGSFHGTGCAEIIFDFVPEAEFHLIKIDNNADFENSVDYALDNNLHVLSMSLGWHTPFGDYFRGQDVMSEIVNEAFRFGLMFVQSAGNAAKSNYRSEFNDEDEEDHYHRFDEDVIVNNFGSSPSRNTTLNRGSLISLTLAWDDFPATDQDFDLELLSLIDDEWRIVARSNNRQNGNDSPLETIDFIVQERGEYGVRVLRQDADNGMDFTLRSYPNNFGFRTSRGSITIPAIAENCMAVGAIDQERWDNPRIETFSSLGPTYDNRIKPDICGPDGVTTWIFNENDQSFFGTSAAGPHVAGAAALVWSNQPGLSNLELKNYLLNNAVDAGNEGEDNTFGWGLLQIEPVERENQWLIYDDGDPLNVIVEENYWSRVSFRTDNELRNLTDIHIMPFNPGPNDEAPCRVLVFSEDNLNNLVGLLWETEIESLEGWDERNIESNWVRLQIPDDEKPALRRNQGFSIIYGPAPGGIYNPEDVREGDGWWNITDNNGTMENRSKFFSGDNPAQANQEWNQLENDLFIRAHTEPRGQLPQQISVYPDEFIVDQPVDTVITVSNMGEGRLSFSLSAAYFNGDDWIILPDEVFRLAPGGQEIINLSIGSFELEEGAYEGFIEISSNDPQNESVLLTVIYNAPEPRIPSIEVDPVLLEFSGQLNDSISVLPFTITNVGNAELSVVCTLNGEAFSIEYEGGSIFPDSSIIVPVDFIAFEEGEYSGSIEINSNDPENELVEVVLHGIRRHYSVKEEDSGLIPSSYYIRNAYPNPFNSLTHIKLGMPVSSEIIVELINVNGRKMRVLHKMHLSAGHHSIPISCVGLSSGIYFIKTYNRDFLRFSKIVLLR